MDLIGILMFSWTDAKDQILNSTVAFARPLVDDNVEEERKKARMYMLVYYNFFL